MVDVLARIVKIQLDTVNVEFIAGKVENTFRQITDRSDIVVFVPLRVGARKRVLERLLELGPDQTMR